MKTLKVEGWRGISHSYALVNQHQLLHLARDPRFALSHRDVPVLCEHWRDVGAGFDAAMAVELANLPLGTDAPADVTYRIAYPFNFAPSPGTRVVVFATWEGQLDAAGVIGTTNLDAMEVITPSNWSRTGLISAGFNAARVTVVPHGVDPTRFRPALASERTQWRERLALPSDAFVFLNVSALTWNKRVDKLVAAFALHQRRHPRSVLLLKGADRLYGSNLRSVVGDARGLRPDAVDQATLRAIHYVGSNLRQEQVAGLYHAADAYVSPYRAEAFNLPVLEAMASGLQVIVTQGGATDDFVPDALARKVPAVRQVDEVGFQYLEPDLQALVEALDGAVASHGRREDVLRSARHHVEAHYSWARVSAGLGDVLDR